MHVWCYHCVEQRNRALCNYDCDDICILCGFKLLLRSEISLKLWKIVRTYVILQLHWRIVYMHRVLIFCFRHCT